MKSRRLLLPSILLVLVGLCACALLNPSTPEPPVAPRQAHLRELHGDRFRDDYFWLRDRTNQAVVAYLEAENTYADRMLQGTETLQEQLYKEMVGRIQETDTSAPTRMGAWTYYHRTEAGLQYPIYCRRPATNQGPEQIILDVNLLADGHTFMDVGGQEVSDDGHWLAYATDSVGYRQYTLHVRDLRTMQDHASLAERITSVAWAADNQTLFFTTEDPVTKRSNQLHRLRLGETPQLIHEEPDERFYLSVSRSRSQRFLFLTAASLTTSEWQFLEATHPTGNWNVVAPREPNHEYYLDHHDRHFFVWSNRSGRNFGAYTVEVSSPSVDHWQELIPPRPEVKLESILCFLHHYVIAERSSGLPKFRVVRYADQASHTIEMPEASYLATPGFNPEYATDQFRYEFESPRTPPSVFDHDLNSGLATLVKQQTVLGGFNPDHYQVERIHARAADGAQVPITLMHRQDTPRDGSAALLLMGYGAYGIPMDPGFEIASLSLADRGVTVALAHIRGGGDLGKTWHDAGRMEHKMNTFTDFIACAEELVKQGHTRPSRLAISGGSAGGLLMGAVTNLRPDLFRAVVTYVPFVDVINTMSDETLPLTVIEYEEWGNPHLPDQYAWIRRYCPYTNLEAKAYPAILVRTSFHDSQVMYWEPAKYVARLRTLKTDHNPLLLKVNMAGGHGGASGRYDRFRDSALDAAFLLTQLGVENISSHH